ncbi:hypothetical protein MRX96_044751 [Rhipicephalus microplus]
MSACFRVNPSAQTKLRANQSKPAVSVYKTRRHAQRENRRLRGDTGIRIGTEQADRMTESRQAAPAAITSAAVPEVGWTSKGRHPRDVAVVFEAGRRDAASPLSPPAHAPP